MKVTVVTVCYNAASTISDAICSVLAQSHSEIEHIIVDGASSDGTVDIIRANQTQKTHVVSEKDSGLYDAMNKGLRLAKGELIGFLNADDFFCRTDAIERVVLAAKKNERASAVVGGVAMVDPLNASRVIRSYGGENFQPWMLRFGHMPPHPSFYVKKSVVEQIGFFDESFRIAADFDWMVRFFCVHKLTAVRLRDTLVGLRTGGVSTRGLQSTKIINHEIGISLRRHSLLSSSALIWSKYAVKASQAFLPAKSYPAPTAVRWMPKELSDV